MRYREEYTVFKRELSSGKIVYYYQTYDEDGNRTSARSTGQTSKTKARQYCDQLKREGRLIPTPQNKPVILKEFTSEWFIWGKCPYTTAKLKRGGNSSESFCRDRRTFLKTYIWPTFGKKRIDKITPLMIENWQEEQLKKRSSQSVKHYRNTLKLILDEAYRLEVIQKNPIDRSRPPIVTNKIKGILELEEVEDLFSENALSEVWEGEEFHFLLNYTSYKTGMRLGEILALRKEDVLDGGIDCKHSFHKTEGLKTPKNGKSRFISTEPKLPKLLLEHCLKYGIGDGFLFSYDGKTPISQTNVQKYFKKALKNIKIDEKARTKRGISFHSWRHFYNDLLVRSQVSGKEIRKQTGHQSESMTDRYSHPESHNIVAGLDRTLAENFICLESIG